MLGGAASKITVEIGGKLAASLSGSLRAAQAQVSGFSRNVTRTFNDAARAGRTAFTGVTNNAMWQASAVAAAGIGMGLASSARVAMQFERSMSSVAAKLGSTAEQTTRLAALAKDLGATTKFTASQAADAMDFLAMAGFKTNDILQATPGILNLAAMSNMDLADSADIVSNILGGMGLEVEKTGRLVDVLAKASVNGNLNVQMMGESFKYAGPIMKQAGVSIEQAAAMMAVLGDSGIQASEAGTGLRGVILRLAAPPKEAAAALQSLGISTKDAQGNLKPMPKLLAEIGTELNKVQGSANRAELAEGLFGKLQIASGNVLLESARLGQLDQRIRTITDSEGAATEMAAKMQDNLAGALTRLGSAAEGFQLALAGPNSKVLQGLVDGLANVVGGATKFLNTFPQIGGVVVAVSAAFVGLVAIAPFLASFIAVAKSLGGAIAAMKIGATIAGWAGAAGPALAALKVGLVALTGPVGLTIAAIVGIGAALVIAYQRVGWFRDGVNAIWNGIKQVFQGVMNYLGGAWKVVTGILMGDANRAKEGVAQAFGGLRQIFGTIVEGIKAVWGGFASFIGGLVQRVVGFFQQHGATILAVMFPIPAAILGAFGALPPGTQSIFNQVVAYIRSVPGMLVDVGRAIIDTIINGIKARAGALVETVKSTFAEVRKLMPFSDAKDGPFKHLTASGKSIVGTLARGISLAAPVMSRAFANAADETMRTLAGPVMTPAFAGAELSAAGVPVRSRPVVPQYDRLDVPTPAITTGGRGAGTVNMHPTINVNVGGTNASPDDIADTVLRAFQNMLGDAEAGVRAFLND